MGDRLPRKLAAILYADVAGYSRLTGEDEDATHRILTVYLDFISSTVDEHGGKVVHYAGDAVLSKFDAVTDAMSAAVAIQNELNERNQALPEERRVHFRIGVNSGDVIEDRGDMYGDGVNIAARLESLADPGGICISDAVRSAVGNKFDLDYEDMGEQTVKNIAEPVRAHKVMVSKEKGKATTDGEPPLEAQEKPSIAVLPFTNMSGDPEQEYFSDGITEDIITELSRFRDLFVIARNSSFVFKNQSVDIGEVGRKLGVRYVVEGSVRKSGQRVRITAQLIDVSTDSHIWGDRYDRELEDIFDVQDEVVRIIASTLVGRVAHAHRDQAQRKPTTNLDAYEWLVQGRELFYNGTPEDNKKACGMFEKAISLDPDYAGAYALLAETYARDWLTFWNEPLEKSLERAWVNAKKSVTLDDTDSQTHTALGVVSLFSGDLDQAHVHLDKALALNPNDTHALIYMARCDIVSGNADRAIERGTQARRNNPFGKYDLMLVPAFYMAHRYDDALNVGRGIQNPPTMMLCWIAASHAQAGNVESGQEIAKEFTDKLKAKLASTGESVPNSWLDFITKRWPFKEQEDREHFIDGLRKAGVPA